MSAPDTLPNALTWADRAACKDQPLELFFTESKTGVTKAKRICRGCPVREECLAEALRAEDSSRYGIFGGLTKEERAELVGSGNAAADMYRGGASIRDIARCLSLSYTAVHQALDDAGVPLRSRGGRR